MHEIKQQPVCTRKQFFVTLSDGSFYERMTDASTNAHWDEPLDVAKMDRLANGANWRFAVRGPKHDKLRCGCFSATSLEYLLAETQHELQQDAGAKVYCLTPDIEIVFENA